MNKLIVTRDLYNISSDSEEESKIAFTVNEPEGEMIAMRSPVGDCIDVNNDGHYVVQKSYWQDLVDIMNSNGYELLHNEANVTANVAGYQTPYAFGKASDKQIEALGYKKVKKTNRHFKPMGENKNRKQSAYYKYMYALYNINEARDINDPALVKARAMLDKYKSNKAKEIPAAEWESIEDELWEISNDLRLLYTQRADIFREMEQEAGSMPYDEFEKSGRHNVYGDELNDVDDSIAKLLNRRAELENKLNTSIMGESIVTEATSYRDFKKDTTLNNEQKINKSIREVNKMLAEVEKLVHNSYKLKVETGFQSDSFWKRSRAAFGKISERMNRISNKIKELGQ